MSIPEIVGINKRDKAWQEKLEVLDEEARQAKAEYERARDAVDESGNFVGEPSRESSGIDPVKKAELNEFAEEYVSFLEAYSKFKFASEDYRVAMMDYRSEIIYNTQKWAVAALVANMLSCAFIWTSVLIGWA